MLSLVPNEYTRLIATLHKIDKVNKTKRGPALQNIYVDLTPGIYQQREALLEVDDVGEILESHRDELQKQFGLGEVMWQHLVNCIRESRGSDLSNQTHVRCLKHMQMLVQQSLKKELDFTGPEYKDVMVKPFFTTKQRKGEQQHNHTTAFGQSGLGKSVALADLICNDPNAKNIEKVYLFSKVASKDKAWLPVEKKFGDRFTPIDLSADALNGPEDDFLQDIPTSVEQLSSNSYIIFDDVASVSNPEVRHSVMSLMNELIQVGRHRAQCVYASSHRFNMYGATAFLKSGSRNYVLFARAATRHLKDDLLRDQYGLPAADRRNLMKKLKVKSRSVFIHNVYPMYIIGGGIVRLLS